MPDNPRIEELRRRVQKDPASIAFAQLAEEYRRAGNHDDAVEVCRSGLEKHPSYLSARVTLGRALIELERFDEAKAELETVLRSAPENLAAIRGLAEIHQRHGDLGEALKQYQSALGIAKHDPDIEESVHELSRQLGTLPPEPAAITPVAPPPPVAASPIPELVEPPPIPIDFGFATPADIETVAAVEAPLVPPPPPSTSPELEAAADEFTKALEALDVLSIEVPTPSFGGDSLDLTPAPDGTPSIDFTPATQGVETAVAVDQVAIAEDVPPEQEPLIDDVTAVEAIPAIEEPRSLDELHVLGEEPRAVDPEPGVLDEEPALAAATPAPSRNQSILNKLESWLDAIVLDRDSRASRA